MEYGAIFIKLIVSFVGLWAMTRLLGKKEISALTPFDFISAVILGDLVGEVIYAEDQSALKLIFALGIWTLLSISFEKITLHLRKLRKPLEGEPEILICNGEIDVERMRKNNLDFDQLRMMLRAKDTFSVKEVAYAIYERNGSLSILKKPPYEAVTREDMELPSSSIHLPFTVVEAGDVQRSGLKKLGKDETWLRRLLQEKGYPELNLVGYAEVDQEGELSVIPLKKPLL